MTSSNQLLHAEEFIQTYERTETPILPERLSGYRFVACLAYGGQKKTWLLEKESGQRILCKYASGEYIDMLRTESSFFSLGKFPFIPYVYDYFENDDGAYLLREYIEGQTLSDLVEREGPLSLSRAVLIILQLCGLLSRFHTAKPPIVFRDLKPSNIVLNSSGDCYLIDMGTVRTYHEDHSLDTVFIGTVDTAAPEQFGARQTDNRTDIYALGILFYYLLTGELKIQEEKLKKLPSKAASVIRKCTAFNPDDRYSQVLMVESALRPSIRFTAGFAAALVSLCTAIIVFASFAFSNFLWNDPIPESSILDTFARKNSLPKDLMAENPMFGNYEPEGSMEVVFSSSLLEQAVREIVGKTDGEPVYEKDLIRITRLEICAETILHPEDAHSQYFCTHNNQGQNTAHGDIYDLSLLAKMSNLHYVVLDYQQIYDLSPLADLQLISLSLIGNPVRDLSPLSDQKYLTDLYIAETDVGSLDALRECSSLSLLDCSNTSVTFLEPLAMLPLRTLYVIEMPAIDFEALSETPLQSLYCSNVPAKYLDSIKNIASLQGLTIYFSGITSLTELSSFSHLVQLDVHGNDIADLDGLEQFTNLKDLSIGDNPITDLSPLVKMNNLSFLNICSGIDADFSFLNEMPWLENITVSSPQANVIYETVPDPWFYINVWE